MLIDDVTVLLNKTKQKLKLALYIILVNFEVLFMII